MNRTFIITPQAWRLSLLTCFLLMGISSSNLSAQITPFFLDSAPPDQTVGCFTDVTPGGRLRAVVLLQSGVLDTIPVFPVDVVSAPNAPCTGGSVDRTWTVTDVSGTATEMQVITFGPADDNSGPSIVGNLLPAVSDTVDCRSVNQAGDPDSYDRWLGDRRIAVAAASRPGCAPIVAISDDAPDSLSGFDCNDRLDVIFEVTDLCGRTATVGFSYYTVDTVGPVIIGVTNDTIRISCEDLFPAAPTVSLEDCDTIPSLMFSESSTQIMDGSCREYDYDVTRSYMATDACGNMSSVLSVIEVRDGTPPDFQRPGNVNLDCTQDPFDLELTGQPTDLTDNCTPTDSLDVTFTDDIISDAICGDNFNVRRTWRVTDRCGNSRVRQQLIRVRDELDPTYTAPVAEVDVSCANYENTDITGRPFNLDDICDETVNLSFVDEITPGDCPGNFTVERRWRIFDDCENDVFFTQMLTVTDTTPPVFTTAPADLVVTCNTGSGLTSQEQRFNEWLGDLAGARFTDGCTADDDLTVSIVESGTNNFPAFPALNCAEADGTVRRLAVDVIVSDQCGNTNIATVEYLQIDEIPINLFFCPESRVVPTEPGTCSAVVALAPPVIQDLCSDGLPFQLMLRDTAVLTSAAMNQAELGSVPVDALVFNMPIDAELPVNAHSRGIFTITLENSDTEGEDEFFFIYGEDGELLGTTAQGTVQCGTVVTTDTLSPFLFNKYATDGVITFTLEPNIPEGQPGTFAINNLCSGGSRALIHLVQPVRRLTEIVYDIDIDGNGFTVIDPIDTLIANLDLGLHQITYRATDCGGNTDECLFTITVEDREPPVVTCPAPIDVVVADDSCQVTLTVPLPVEVTDNCEPYTVFTEEVPALDQDRLFPFFTDPNLNSLQAGPISLTLSEAPGALVDSVDIEVFFTGAFDNQSAILDVLLPDGSTLGSTAPGSATCDNRGSLLLKLAASRFLALANADGSLSLNLRPRPVTVPPGQPGEGLIPCDAAAVTSEGDHDGISRAWVRVSYRTLFPDYYTEGATTTPRTATSTANPLARLTFNQGVTNFSYIVTDPSGNADTCTIAVTVRDTTAPVARCQPTTVFIDPSGQSPVTLDPALVDAGSTDNCAIVSSTVSPNEFICAQYGETASVTLRLEDASGNTDSCTTIISIAPLPPEPTATTSVCGGDTLRLFANPPTVASPGQTLYTFRWFAPAGNLISTQQNPIIPGATPANDGAYRVVIRGLTGCEAEGIVNVAIGNIPSAPVIEAPLRVCIGGEAPLTSVSTYAGDVRYEWFRGQPGAGTLLGSSNTATFSAAFTDGENSGTFYAIAYVNGCASPPSNVVSVGTTTQPSATVSDDVLMACEFTSVTLRAQPEADVAYVWTGPNNFMANGREVVLSDLALEDAGEYYLRTVRSGGCFSQEDTVQLNVVAADAPVTLTANNNRICGSDTLTLTASDATGLAYLYQGPSGQMIESASATIRIAPVTEAVVGNWTVSIQRNECLSRPSPPVSITLNQSPVATAMTLPDPVCTGNDLVLQGSSDIPGSSYRWTGPDGFEMTGIAPVIPDVSLSNNGMYVLEVTSPAGCISKDSIEVSILPGIRIDSFSISSANCLNGGEPVSLMANVRPLLNDGADYTYAWSGPEGTSSEAVFEIPNVSLASNGTYTLTIMNEAGCSSNTFSMPVEFNFAPAAPVTPFTPSGVTSICGGEELVLQTNDFGPGVTYLWQLPDGTNIPSSGNSLSLPDADPTLTGVFTVRVIRGGCTSLPSEGRMITVTPFPEIVAMANDPACTGQEINFQATDISGATYSWRGPNNFSSSLANPTIVNADASVHAGRYSVVATLNGCSSDTMFVDIDVNPTPGVPVAQPISPFCISDPDAVLLLRVNPNTTTEGANYEWFIQNGQVSVGPPTESLDLEITDFGLFAGGGLFDFQVRSVLDGCESALSAPITVRLDEVIDQAADAGRDSVICEGLYLLEAGPFSSGSGRWTLVQGTGDISIANPGSRITAVSGLTQFGGPYQFAWTLSNGSCIDYSSDTLTLTVTDGEEAEAGENLIACAGEEFRLNATPVAMVGSGGEWTQGLAQQILGVVIDEPTNPNTTLSGLQPDNTYSFTWTVTSNCGVKMDNVLVNVSDPSPFAGPDAVACNPNRTFTLAADTPTQGSVGRWTALNDQTIIAEPDNPSSTVSNLQEGENHFVWETDAGFCGDRSRDTVTIVFAEPPRPRDDELEASFQGSVTFTPSVNDENPEGSVISFPDVGSGMLTDNGDGSFTFQAPANFVGEIELDYEVSSEGCPTASATAFIQVGKDVDCTPPNIFTPNNDGMNDNFVVPCLLDSGEFPESQVTIYNQWGDEVYRSDKPYNNDWDGTYQGSPLPVATYFYIIDFGGSRERESGDVRIER